MTRANFALCLALLSTAAAAQSEPASRAATPQSEAQGHECEPYPACLVIDSPLRPGAPGIGIRDKALLDLLQGPVRQPQKEGIIKKPEQQ
jgi:hypothetical protein